jgi:hypothetical protein
LNRPRQAAGCPSRRNSAGAAGGRTIASGGSGLKSPSSHV